MMNITISADGMYYMRKAAGHPVPSPYHRRWFLPYVLGPYPIRWFVCTYTSLTLTPFAAWLYFGTWDLTSAQRLFAAALLSVMPGVWLAPYRYPVLIDAPSFLMTLVCAWLARTNHPWIFLLIAPTLAVTRETGPLFAALWAWHPAPLVGLLAVRWWREAPPPDSEWLAHPIRRVWQLRRAIGLDSTLYLRPFGAALVGLTVPSWQLWITVVMAHAQIFIAHDVIRLTVWCAPVMVAHAAQAIPQTWWALALIATALHWDERI